MIGQMAATKDALRKWSADRGSRVVIAIGIFLVAYGAWQIFRWGCPAHQQAIGDAAYWPVNFIVVLLCWRVARRGDLDRRVRRAWWLIGAGMLSYLIGDVVQFVYEVILRAVPYPFPSVSDLFYLIFYPLALAGIMQFPRAARTRAATIRAGLYGSTLLVGSAAVVWFVILAPDADTPGDLFSRLVTIAYPCGDLLLLFCVTLLLIGKSSVFEGRVLYLFSASLMVFVVTDLIYGRLLLTNSYIGGDPIDTGWMVSIALVGVSANEFWRTTNNGLTTDPPKLDHEGFSFLPYVTFAVTFALMVASLGRESDIAKGAVGFVAAAVILVLACLLWSSIEKDRQGRYFQALVERVSDYVVVLDRELEPTYISPPLLRLLGLSVDIAIDGRTLRQFVLEEDQPIVQASFERASANPSSDTRSEMRFRGADGDTIHMIGVTTNLLDDPAVTGLVLVLHDITEKARLEDELRHQALHDALTGLPNRALINDRLAQMPTAARRHQSEIAVLYIDVDNFKDVNDSLGHGAGDELLQAVARRLDRVVKGHDTVGRVGGDEFVVLAEIPNGTETATLIAQRVLDAMVEPFEIDGAPGRTLSVGVSIGVAVTGFGPPSDPLRDADLALYRAKASGKNCFVVFEPEMYELAAKKVELEYDLSDALVRGEFFLVFQPIIDLDTLAPLGVEALLRWQHPTRGVIGPEDFIPLLEDRGMIVDVGRWVLNQACVHGSRLQRDSMPLSMSVNVSAHQLRSDRFVADVGQVLATSGLDPALLVIELTETALLVEPETVAATLKSLKSLGLRVAIDDFGTGYSALAYLRKFPIDILKIDRSFVGDIDHSDEAAILVRSLVDLGRELGIAPIAEGVETRSQLSALRSAGCHIGQGYLFAKPMRPEALVEFLATWKREAPDLDLRSAADQTSGSVQEIVGSGSR